MSYNFIGQLLTIEINRQMTKKSSLSTPFVDRPAVGRQGQRKEVREKGPPMEAIIDEALSGLKGRVWWRSPRSSRAMA